MDFKNAIMKRLSERTGQPFRAPGMQAGQPTKSSNGPVGILSRGSNVYNSGLPQAVKGRQGPNFGRPSDNPQDARKRAIARRLGG